VHFRVLAGRSVSGAVCEIVHLRPYSIQLGLEVVRIVGKLSKLPLQVDAATGG